MDDKILERMKKLLAMSQDPSSEQEVMIATKRLHALLAKYNVLMTEIEKDKEDVNETEFLLNLLFLLFMEQ